MVTTSLWGARKEAEISMVAELKPYADILDEAIEAVDISTARLEILDKPFGESVHSCSSKPGTLR